MKLTTGKKKGDAISKGAKIGGTLGAVNGAANGLVASRALGMGKKAALGIGAAQAVGGAIKGALYGAGAGAAVKAVKNRKKNKFNNTKLDTFADPVFIASFPKQQVETKTTKSAIELAQEKLKLKDDYSSILDNIYKT